MPTLLQINITANWGSHGRIAEQLGSLVKKEGWSSYLAYGRWCNPSESKLIRIGSLCDEYLHVFSSRCFDNHGLSSRLSTARFIEVIKTIHPDVIHLHNIHGYYVNYPLLFNYLIESNTPVIWTLHDCWPITGHCSHFMHSGCDKWKTGCYDCVEIKEYPKSFFIDRSSRNYSLKKQFFTSLDKLTLVPVSNWLDSVICDSFLSQTPSVCIHNGINLKQFRYIKNSKASLKLDRHYIILAVANKWTKRKGIEDVLELRNQLDENYLIVIVGVDNKTKKNLPPGLVGITRTNSIDQLAEYYSAADVFINPTYEDNFPTTNIEALACGTPVITYNTGGSGEAIDGDTGIIVKTGDIASMKNAIELICKEWSSESVSMLCRQRADRLFNADTQYRKYINLYYSVLK